MNINSYTVSAPNGIATTAWGVADLFKTIKRFTSDYSNASFIAH